MHKIQLRSSWLFHIHVHKDVQRKQIRKMISRVRYCVSVYGNGSAANGGRLLKVINFATRVVTGLRRYDHVSRARCDLGLLTPREMSDIRTVIVAHRACVEGLPADLASMLSTNAAARSSERVTRQDRLLRPPTMRTAAGQRSFAYRAASLLNKLPESVRGRPMSSFCRAVIHFFSQDMT